MQSNIVGVRFSKIGKLYHFDAGPVADIKIGEYVVVETSRGRQIGEIIQFIREPSSPMDGSWKSIERRATPADLLLRKQWQQKQV